VDEAAAIAAAAAAAAALPPCESFDSQYVGGTQPMPEEDDAMDDTTDVAS